MLRKNEKERKQNGSEDAKRLEQENKELIEKLN